jgi:hypothetical protein
MKRVNVAAMLAGSVLLLTSAPAFAATHTAKISLFHLNSAVHGRGVCVQTQPAMPNTWACLWKNNPLYTEITDLLRDAYVTNKTCSITWDKPDPNGWNLVALVECRR